MYDFKSYFLLKFKIKNTDIIDYNLINMLCNLIVAPDINENKLIGKRASILLNFVKNYECKEIESFLDTKLNEKYYKLNKYDKTDIYTTDEMLKSVFILFNNAGNREMPCIMFTDLSWIYSFTDIYFETGCKLLEAENKKLFNLLSALYNNIIVNARDKNHEYKTKIQGWNEIEKRYRIMNDKLVEAEITKKNFEKKQKINRKKFEIKGKSIYGDDDPVLINVFNFEEYKNREWLANL